jgi:hypothetical protein
MRFLTETFRDAFVYGDLGAFTVLFVLALPFILCGAWAYTEWKERDD